MLQTNTIAPDFELQDQSGTTVSLSGLLAQGDVILYFYPADFSPVCTVETCAFRDNFADLANVGTQVVGISPQSVASHKRFADSYNVPFPLLSDPGKKVIRAFGVDGPFGMGVRRVTYLVDQAGLISNRVVADFAVSSHVNLVRQTLRGANPGA